MPTTLQLEVLVRQPDAAVAAAVEHPTPILFVHGSWHTAWCWDEHFLPYFAAHGYRSYALSLRGHGKSESTGRFRTTRIWQYANDVAQVAATLDRPPVVVGHSMGSLVVQKYLEQHEAPAAALLAPGPPYGVWRTTLAVARRHPLRFIRANVSWKLYPLVETPQLAQESLFSSEMPPDQVKSHWTHLQNESYFAFLDMLAFGLPHPKRAATPVLVIGGEKDALFTPHEVQQTAHAYSADVTIFPGVAHDLMLEAGWQRCADAILEWLQLRGI